MSDNESVLKVFVASPSDVSDEREALREVVVEINRTFSALSAGLRLDVNGWEDAAPDFGADAQDVINKRFDLAEFDVVIVIVWLTIGTETSRSMSGTVEEYERARAVRENSPDEMRLMVYRKTKVPSMLTNIDPVQLQKVNDFCAGVGSDGGLYKTFTDTEDFANGVKFALIEYATDWRKRTSVVEDGDDLQPDPSDTRDIDDEEGLFELEDMFEENGAALRAVMGRISESLSGLNGSMSARQPTLDKAVKSINTPEENSPKKKQARATMRRIVKETATDMNEFIRRMHQELPMYRQHVSRSLGSFAKLIPMYLEMDRHDDLEELQGVVSETIESLSYMQSGAEDYTNILNGTPRYTTSFGRAKNGVIKVMQEHIDVTQGGIASLRQADAMIRDGLENLDL